ncbi:low molecular weight protein arginine phosphatase [Defluviitalea phaphyphila]|uniref:low molecular weight protein arginine phosphatase n=1 Tax=Defluviitalea phaphyphila TaxID=1473580 RepID=UPI0007316741|nr:low molecular weight protein arginine phosphatase [Defluviitalea phaphyphila]
MKRILFVCTGNTCRSPMAEALAKKEINKYSLDINAFSRGIAVYFPSEASKHAIEAMKEYDVDLSDHKSKQLDIKDIEEADIILTMTNRHKQYLLLNFKEHKEKIFTLKEFVEEFGDVKDPFGGNIEDYKNCAKDLNNLIKKLIEKLYKNM